MFSHPHLALLRGINVGGKNIIPMAELKKCFEELGFANVATYIQSGNVVFDGQGGEDALTKKIETALSKKFAYTARVLVVSHATLKAAVRGTPKEFGSDPDHYRYDVIFLMPPLTAREAMKQVQTKDGVDTAHAGKHALYFSRLTSKAAQSYLPRIIKLPIYQAMTIRNWNTTTKLLAMMDERAGGKTCSRGHAFSRTKEHPVCPKCWPGYYIMRRS
jgi:uncharacterized protein (DUF1697 family)